MSGGKETIGFIGVGVMGKSMALNLLKAGYPVVAHDLNPKPLEELKQKGATIGKSSKEIASQSNVVITMLPNSEDVEKVILGENGVVEGVGNGAIVIDMSTIDPSVSRKIAQILGSKNIRMLDAPVSGGPPGAEAGTLSIMVGGDEGVFHQCENIFKAMGKNIFYCGANGNGATVKCVNNLLTGTFAIISAEALALGVKAGVDFKTLFDVISVSTGQNVFIKTAGAAKAFKGDFEPGFMADLMYKDLGIAVTLAKEQGVPLPVGALCHQMFSHLKAAGLGKKDWTITIKPLEDLLNIKLRF
ncbi:MAG: NAD(P)-dependent oxidoreductase [Desulfobacterales bacterium]|nr:NAD(P)-dependent oxidoreductase [Desulfobacterales bacterium]